MDTMKSIKWKIDGDVVSSYDASKPCDQQGIVVHANQFDLLLIKPNESQVVGAVIEAFTGRHRFRIHFLMDSEEDIAGYDHKEAIEAAIIVAAATVLAVAVLTVIHNFKWRTHLDQMSSKHESSKNKAGPIRARSCRKQSKKESVQGRRPPIQTVPI